MKDQWEQEGAALRAEVATLQRQVRELAAQLANANTRAHWGVSKSLKFVLLPVCMLLAAGGVLYGHGAMDALFIDQQGRVGIGKTDPQATLDVAGTLNVAQKANLADTTIKGPLTTEGKVGIGTTEPNAKLQVDTSNTAASQALILSNSNNSFAADEGVYQSYYVGQTTGNEMARILAANKTAAVGSDGYLAFSTRNSDSLTEKVRIDNTGNVGIGITEPKDKLDVAGPLRVLTGSNPIRFTSGWSGFPNESGVTNQAEIANDTKDYKALMIVGNMSAGGTTRRVKVYDQLDVAGDLVVKGLPIRREIKPNLSQNAPWNTDTFPIDPYCSDFDGCRVVIVAEPPGGESDNFRVIATNIALSSGGSGNTDRWIHMADRWGEVRCQVSKNCGRNWYHQVKLDVATDKLAVSLLPRWGAKITIYDN